MRKERKDKIKKELIIRDGLECCYCNKQLTFDSMTLDHIVPGSKKGAFNTTNLTVACEHCNHSRGNQNFFSYIKQFKFTDSKVSKYRKLYFNNLKIKVLNICKEELLKSEENVPNELVKQACEILKIKDINYNEYENYNLIDFNVMQKKSKIIYAFEQLILLINKDSF
jgi:hypothetical protein